MRNKEQIVKLQEKKRDLIILLHSDKPRGASWDQVDAIDRKIKQLKKDN